MQNDNRLDSAMALLIEDLGYSINYKSNGFGYSYYVLTPDGEAIVPTSSGVVKKPLAEVDHMLEGWMYPSHDASQKAPKWNVIAPDIYHKAQILERFVDFGSETHNG